MEITYLQALRDYPSAYPDETFKQTIEPTSLSDITFLEQLYNNGNPFPVTLKELLLFSRELLLCIGLWVGRFAAGNAGRGPRKVSQSPSGNHSAIYGY
jgi:hypothetical protein